MRLYQAKAVSDALTSREALLVAPTGSGKTWMAREIIEQRLHAGDRTLFIAHTREIVEQTCRAFDARSLPYGVIMSGHEEDRDQPIQVASVATVIRRVMPRVEFVVVDEAHRVRAQSYQRVLSDSGAGRVLGLTATPVRLDGRSLLRPHGPFGKMVHAASAKELVAQGHLVPIRVFSAPVPDAESLPVDRRKRDFDTRAASAHYTRNARIVGEPVEAWKRHGFGKRTVVFAIDVKHAQALHGEFVRAGVSSAVVTGNTPRSERAAALNGLAKGSVLVVINVGVLTEGFDAPEVEVISVVRPTLSLSLWVQMAGRGARTINEGCVARLKELGGFLPPNKRECILLDHGGNAFRHGHPFQDRDWTSYQQAKRGKGDSHSAMQSAAGPGVKCLACHAETVENGICTACGAVQSDVMPRAADGHLVAFPDP